LAVNGAGERLTSIVLPVRDQEGHVEAIVRGYLRALPALPGRYELVLVTNGCRDRSPEL